MKTLIDLQGKIWVSRGGYDVDENEVVICYWCILAEELQFFDVEFCSYTKVNASEIKEFLQ